MYKFLKKYQKQVMAVFAAFLMVAFLATLGPTSCGQPTNPDIGAQLVGHLGEAEVHRIDVQQAESEWGLLSRRVLMHGRGTGLEQWQPITNLLPDAVPTGRPDIPVIRLVHEQMHQQPKLYYLLQAEALKMGLSPQFAEADQLVEDPRFGVRLPDQRVVAFADVTDQVLKRQIRASLANLLMVRDAYVRAVDAFKVSEPQVQHEMAARMQEIKVRVVDFNAKDYADKVGTPTSEQLGEHFKQFADFETGAAAATESNPFAFGYKFPNRIKLQYIAIPRDQVRAAVRASQSDYDWDVEANRYYLQHKHEFIATSQPSTQEAFSLGPSIPKTPTTRPFAEVRDQVLESIIEPRVQQLQVQIQSDLTTRFQQDFEAYRKQTSATTAPSATAPSTTAPSEQGYASFEYLQKVAADIQKKFNVTPTVASIGNSFKSRAELRELDGIGKVSQFPDYALIVAEPFVPAEQKNAQAVLPLFKASRPQFDESRNMYIFRITDTQAAHKPESIEPVKQQVEQDWKRMRAYELAKSDAQKTLEAAKASGLEVAAGGRKVITTGPYSRALLMSPMAEIENYDLPPQAKGKFVIETTALVGALAKSNPATKPSAATTSPSDLPPGPATLVEFPADGKVSVAELIAVESVIPLGTASLAEAMIASQLRQQVQYAWADEWYNYNSVAQRLNFKPSREE